MASPLQLAGGQAVGGWALALVRGQAPVLGEHQPPRVVVFLTAGYWVGEQLDVVVAASCSCVGLAGKRRLRKRRRGSSCPRNHTVPSE